MTNRILIYDPVPFKGGSKEVMKTILAELPEDIEVWVISNDHKSWCHSKVKFLPLFSPQCLFKQTAGIRYFIKHLVYLISFILHLSKLKRIDKIIAISGPCVDFSLYLLSEIIHIDTIQLIQGNIPNSKVASFGLARAKQVFYLPSTKDSISQVLKRKCSDILLNKNKYIPFINGINRERVKTKISNDCIGFFWAASLSKWKHIELFIAAIEKLNELAKYKNNYFASICYIKPLINAYFDLTNVEKIKNIQWYHDPSNLNDIRASASVFISTAQDEPFGLSTLESMFAGLAIVIPADNAYWDNHLVHGYDCLKYRPNDMHSLVQVLTQLINNPALLSKISQQAKRSAQHYCPRHCYSKILKCILN